MSLPAVTAAQRTTVHSDGVVTFDPRVVIVSPLAP